MKTFYSILVSCVLLLAVFAGVGVYLGNVWGEASESWLAVGAKIEKFLDAIEEKSVTGITREVVNENNLIKGENYTFVNGSTANGVVRSFDANGVITLNGKVLSSTRFCLGERVILEKGYYTISCEGDLPLRTRSHIVLQTLDADGKTVELVKTSFAEPVTFYSDGLQYVDVYISCFNNEDFNNYQVKPVLVAGEHMQSFFVTEIVPLG